MRGRGARPRWAACVLGAILLTALPPVSSKGAGITGAAIAEHDRSGSIAKIGDPQQSGHDGTGRSAEARASDAHTPLVGSYAGSLLTNSLASNLSSDADVPATVVALLRTSQTIVGMAVDQCRDFELLRPMLTATAGTGISVFGVLGSHNGPIYCDAVYGMSVRNASAPAASGQQLNWTRVTTTLAAIAAEFPHFVGFTIDDFYCMMEDPFEAADPLNPPLSVAELQRAINAGKAVAPGFRFMPTVYPMYLGVVAGNTGYTLGVGPGLPFDTQTSASLTLTPQPAVGGRRGKGIRLNVSFWVSSGFATWSRKGFANPIWRGKLFVRCLLHLHGGDTLLLADVDMFHLTGCAAGDVGAASVSHCIPQEMMQVAGSAPLGAGVAWSAVTIEVYARAEVNLNFYNSKIQTVWGVAVAVDGQPRPPSSFQASFTARASNATFQNVSNVGKVQAHDNAALTVAPAADGLLFPFAEDAGRVYTDESYRALLGLALDATQGRGQAIWALHYGWMWPATGDPAYSTEVDPAALARLIEVDRTAGVDAVLVFELPMEVGQLAAQRGIFTERLAGGSAISAAGADGFLGGVAQGWFPGYTPGYGGWFQSWTSRAPVSGNISFGVDRRRSTGHRLLGDGSPQPAAGGFGVGATVSGEPWYFAVTIRVADGGPILFNASADVAACTGAGAGAAEGEGRPAAATPCPGIESAAAAAINVTCSVRCAAASAAFPEVVHLGVVEGGDLPGNANGNLRLVLEFSAHRGVGNYPSGVRFAVAATGASSGCGTGDAVPGWVYQSGLREASVLSSYWASVGALAAAGAG